MDRPTLPQNENFDGWEHDPDRAPVPWPLGTDAKGVFFAPIDDGWCRVDKATEYGFCSVSDRNFAPLEGTVLYQLRGIRDPKPAPLLYGAKVGGRIVAVASFALNLWWAGSTEPLGSHDDFPDRERGCETPQAALAAWGGEVVALGEVDP